MIFELFRRVAFATLLNSAQQRSISVANAVCAGVGPIMGWPLDMDKSVLGVSNQPCFL